MVSRSDPAKEPERVLNSLGVSRRSWLVWEPAGVDCYAVSFSPRSAEFCKVVELNQPPCALAALDLPGAHVIPRQRRLTAGCAPPGSAGATSASRSDADALRRDLL